MNNNKKKFFLKLATLGVTLLFVDFGAGVFLKSLFFKQKSGKYFTTTHAITDANEDVLIFGNSHASQHFDAPLMKEKLSVSVFNFGNQGQSFLYCYPLMKSVLSYRKPKLVVLDLDYGTLEFDEEEYKKLSIFLPYYHYNAVIDSAIEMIGDKEDIKANSFLFRYNSTVGYTLLNTYHPSFNKSMESLGYDPVEGSLCGPESDSLSKQAKEELTNLRIDSVKLKELLGFINYVKVKRINLLITTTPLFNFDNYRKKILKEKLDKILTSMNVDYLDYGNSTVFKGKCELFSDGSHLNSTGADRWTSVCIDYIKSKQLLNENHYLTAEQGLRSPSGASKN